MFRIALIKISLLICILLVSFVFDVGFSFAINVRGEPGFGKSTFCF